MTRIARGTFEVRMSPAGPDGAAADPSLGRMTLDKDFHGDLEGTSQGQMLFAGTSVEGSAGYVAIERLTGTLHGRQGTLVLQHNGIMNRGAGELAIRVVPDSGTGGLEGLAGQMVINIEGQEHSYELVYTLGEAE
jgi:uncharacterized protein DUF3224